MNILTNQCTFSKTHTSIYISTYLLFFYARPSVLHQVTNLRIFCSKFSFQYNAHFFSYWQKQVRQDFARAHFPEVPLRRYHPDESSAVKAATCFASSPFPSSAVSCVWISWGYTLRLPPAQSSLAACRRKTRRVLPTSLFSRLPPALFFFLDSSSLPRIGKSSRWFTVGLAALVVRCPSTTPLSLHFTVHLLVPRMLRA